MQQEPPSRPDLMGEVRVRVPLPLVVPVAAVVVIAALTFGFSRVLLTVPPEAATIVALVTAANVLIASAFIALRPRLHRVGVLEVALIALYPVLIGVVIANSGIGEEQAAPAEEAQVQQESSATSGAGGAGVTLTAANLSFDTSEITLPAGKEVTVTLDNQDTTEHNFSLYESDADAAAQSNAIFTGDHVAGGDSADLTFKAPPAGDYPFQCDIHPSMAGTATVE